MDDSPRMQSALERLINQIERLNDYFDDQVKKQNDKPLRQQEAERATGMPIRPYQEATSGHQMNFWDDELDPRATATVDPSDLAQVGTFKSMLGRMASWHQPINAAEDPSNRAVDSGRSLPGIIDNPMHGRGPTPGVLDNDSAITLALLGEHGGPAFLRNAALDVYGINRSLSWANTASSRFATSVEQRYAGSDSAFGGAATLGSQALSGALSKVSEHPYATYAGIKLLQGVGAINHHLSTMQTIGQQFGYGPPPGGAYIGGFRNILGDVGTAAQVGLSFEMEKQALQGRVPGQGLGNGLSGKQAQDVLDTLGNQGFGMQPASFTGDAATIAQNFMRPLMEKFPGVGAQDLGEFTGQLRYGNTSVQQLTDQLSNLGIEAKAAKENVGEFTSALADTGHQFANMKMGSVPGGTSIGAGFSNVTGLDPRASLQFAQSPVFQAMGLSQGILPSGLADLNSGMFSGMAQSTVQMYAKLLGPMFKDRYVTRNGMPVLVQSGKKALEDQIARSTGIDQNIIHQMMGDSGPQNARAQLQTDVGDPNSSTGMYAFLNAAGGHLNAKQYAYADKYWKNVIEKDWTPASGISHQQLMDLEKTPGMYDRAKKLSALIAGAAKDDKQNQIQNTATKYSVQVSFTGEAAKLFKVSSISSDKEHSNAGNGTINGVVNSVLGHQYSPRMGAYPRFGD